MKMIVDLLRFIASSDITHTYLHIIISFIVSFSILPNIFYSGLLQIPNPNSEISRIF